jgi:hypothetical protein
MARITHIELDRPALAEQPRHVSGAGYAIIDASLGYRFDRFTIALLGTSGAGEDLSSFLPSPSKLLPLWSFAGGLEAKRNGKLIRVEAILQVGEELQQSADFMSEFADPGRSSVFRQRLQVLILFSAHRDSA